MNFNFYIIGHFNPESTFTNLGIKPKALSYAVSGDKLISFTANIFCGKQNPKQGKEEMIQFISVLKDLDVSNLKNGGMEATIFFHVVENILS